LTRGGQAIVDRGQVAGRSSSSSSGGTERAVMKLMGAWSVSSFLAALLSVAWYALALVIAVLLCVIVATPFIDLSGAETSLPVAFHFQANAFQVTAPALGVEQAQLDGGQGTLRFPIQQRGPFLAAAAGFVLLLAFGQWVIGELRAVFRTLREGQPFVRANAMRIRRVAWAVMLGEIIRATLMWASSSYAMRHFSGTGLRFDASLDLDVPTIVNGLIILVIAEVFRAGTRLDEEQSLTI
jgi:hypothetical protein